MPLLPLLHLPRTPQLQPNDMMRNTKLVKLSGCRRWRENEIWSKLNVLRPESAGDEVVLCAGDFDDRGADEGVGETDLAEFGGGERVRRGQDVGEEGGERIESLDRLRL
jgi:hypothetical protein